jgi:hypothetical protein
MGRVMNQTQWGSVILSASAASPAAVVETYRAKAVAGVVFGTSAGREVWEADPATVNVHASGSGGGGLGTNNSRPGALEFASGGVSWLVCDSSGEGALLVDLICQGQVMGRMVLGAGVRIRQRVTGLRVVGVLSAAPDFASVRLMYGTGEMPEVWAGALPGRSIGVTVAGDRALGDSEQVIHGAILAVASGSSTAFVSKVTTIPAGWSLRSGGLTLSATGIFAQVVTVPAGVVPTSQNTGAVIAETSDVAQRVVNRGTGLSQVLEIDPLVAGGSGSAGVDVYLLGLPAAVGNTAINVYAAYRLTIKRGE